MSLAFWKISRNGRWSSPRRSPPAAAARSSGETAARADRNGSPRGLNSGDGAPAAPAGPAARATSAEDATPPRACRSRGGGREGEKAAWEGEGVGRRRERKVEAEVMVGGRGGAPAAACELGGVGRRRRVCVDNLVGTREMNGVVHDLSWALERYGPRGLSKGGLFRFSLNPSFFSEKKT